MKQMFQDPYSVLGVSPDASDEEIKKAYRDLTKKYHPDLNPGDEDAARKMNDVNTAYDQIKSGNVRQRAYAQNAQQYQRYQQYADYTGWNGWNAWNAWNNDAQYRQTERSEYTAAKNYIRNGMYREALNALSGVPYAERDGRWYYLSAGANMYMGNKAAALENAKKAVELEPGNEDYASLLAQLQSGGNFYDNYTRNYQTGFSPSTLCFSLCAMQFCLGPLCGFRIICC